MRQSLNKDEKKVVGNLIREHLDDNEILNIKSGDHTRIASAKELAWESKLADATIHKLHSGDFSMKTLRKVEAILGVNFSEKLNGDEDKSTTANRPAGFDNAVATKLGGYSKEQVKPYIGRFLTCRRGATVSTNLLCTLVDISWDDEIDGARFYETNKFVSSYGKEMDYSQSGTVHISPQIGVIHLLTSVNGALRLVTLTRMQVVEPVMYGAILTQVPESGHYVPIKSTVHYRRLEDSNKDELSSLIGAITPDHPSFEALSADLDEAERAILVR